jgi:hypothetical protein
MARSFDEIVRMIQDMQRVQSTTLRGMRDVLDRYNGDWILPMPDISNEPNLPPLTPALIGEAVDSMALRASSVRPRVTTPALQPNKQTGKRSQAYAVTRRKIIAATYHQSKWSLGRRRFYRQLAAYNTGSLVVIPDFKLELPRLEVRDPLATFVEPQANEEVRPPGYVAFINRHSGAALRANFPRARSENGGLITPTDTIELWDVAEWIDHDQIVFGIVGPVSQYGAHIDSHWAQSPYMQLGPAAPNRTGLCPAVVPHNVSLGGIASRIGSMLGSVDLQAKLMALDILAQEKAIFPDLYILGSRDGGMPTILGGKWKDGREGDANIIVDADSIGMLRSTPDQRTSQLIDRLERNFRTSTGLVPQFGGETYGALRTGRGIDALAGIAVDPRIQEMHEISEAWMPHLNSVILATYKGYWPDQKFTVFSGWAGDRGIIEFTPSEHIETLENTVTYPIPGADIIQLTQILGSMLGTKGISLDTFRTKHPWIDDPEDEQQLVQVEQFEEALQQSLLQQLVNGQLPLPMVSMLVKEIRDGSDIFKAMALVDEQMRAQQATQAPPAPEGMIAPPESMPGMAAGPAALQQPAPPPPPETPEPGIQPFGEVSNMRALMAQMAAR